MMFASLKDLGGGVAQQLGNTNCEEELRLEGRANSTKAFCT